MTTDAADDHPSPARQFERQIEIAVDPDTVWRALTDARELTRWFPPEARVEPGPGGTIFMSWGEGMEGPSAIEAWAPGRHLRLAADHPDPSKPRRDDGTRPTARLVRDFWIAGDAGRTVLRLVHAGFGPDAAWDDEVGALDRGWAWFFLQLRHYLERHAGQDRAHIWMHRRVACATADAWARVVGPDGLGLGDAVSAGAPGDPYAATGAAGAGIAGTIAWLDAPTNFAGTLTDPDDALLMVEVLPAYGQAMVSLFVSAWGDAAPGAEAWRTRAEHLLGRLFP